MATKKKDTKDTSTAELEELRRRLTEAHRQRNLLIEALHGLTTSTGTGVAMDAQGGIDGHTRYLKILNRLTQALMNKNYPLPITAQTKVSDLNPDPLPIVVLINSNSFRITDLRQG